MSIPLVIQSTVTTPQIEGSADCPFPISFTSQYNHLVKNRLVFTGIGTKSVDFGSLALIGAKAIAVTVDVDVSPAALPVLVTINGGDEAIEISQGGFLLFGSPIPTAAGILSIDIAYASSVKMYVWIFG